MPFAGRCGIAARPRARGFEGSFRNPAAAAWVSHRLGSQPRRTARQEACAADLLETRVMLTSVTAAVNLSAQEQLFVELVNRARQDPLAEANRLGIGLNAPYNPPPGSGGQYQPPPDPRLTGEAREVLAVNPILQTAAVLHSRDMLTRDYFDHTNPDGETPSDRVEALGYDGVASENIAYDPAVGSGSDREMAAEVLHRNLWASVSHRVGMLNDSPYLNEVGIGLEYGGFPVLYSDGVTRDTPVAMVTEKFGLTLADRVYFTGVAYTDASSGAANDNFYTVGEGISGGRVVATNLATEERFIGEVNAVGGYNILLGEGPDFEGGTYSLTLEYGGEEYDWYRNVRITDENFKADFDLDRIDPNPPPPPPPGPAYDDIIGFVEDTGAWWVARAGEDRLRNIRVGRWNANIDWQHITYGDFNGDGQQDVFAWNPNGRLNVGLIDQAEMTMSQEHWGVWSSSGEWVDVQAGDFNGDGRDDIVGRDLRTGIFHVGLSNGSGFDIAETERWATGATFTDVRVHDMNGDGFDDLVGVVNGVGVRVSHSLGTTSSSGAALFDTSLAAWWGDGAWEGVRYGDFNGDGHTDIVRWDSQTGELIVSENDGTAASELADRVYGVFGTGGNWEYWTVGDFDGDAADDIIAYHRPLQRWYVGTSTGPVSATTFDRSQMNIWAREEVFLDSRGMDLDGDGKDELVAREFESGNWIAQQRDGDGWLTRRVGGWTGGPIWAGVDSGEFLLTPPTSGARSVAADSVPAAVTADAEEKLVIAALDALFEDETA